MDLLNHTAAGATNASTSLVCFSDGSDGGLALGIESHRSMPAPFLTKTSQLVDDPTTNHIVSWGDDNITFVVWRPADFARDLLPNYFKHNNFSSFVRQLNTYSFRKIVPDRWEFANEFFRKGEKHLLCEIHRRKTAQNNRCSPTNSTEELMMAQQQQGASSWAPALAAHTACPMSSHRTSAAFAVAAAHHMSMQQAAAAAATARNMQNRMNNFSMGPCTTPSTSVLSLTDENERLRRDNTLLLSELTRMRKLYNDVLIYIQQQQQNATRTSNSSYPNAASSNEFPSKSETNHTVVTPLVNHMLPSSSSSFHAGSTGFTSASRVTTPIKCVSNGPARSLETTTIPFTLETPQHEMSITDHNMERQEAADASATLELGVALPVTKSAVMSQRVADKSISIQGWTSAGEKSPPKLFGVPLNWCKKRSLELAPVDGQDGYEEEHTDYDEDHGLRSSGMHIMKSAKKSHELAGASLETSKEPAGVQGKSSLHDTPWLKFIAINRDEQVYN